MSSPQPNPRLPPAPVDPDPPPPAAAGRAPLREAPPEAPARRRAPGPAAPSTRARLVAFGGLFAMIAAVALVVAGSLAPGRPALRPVAVRVAAHPRYWIVRPGQTLSSIASREIVPVDEIVRLNPRLIPGSLISGQRVRLPG